MKRVIWLALPLLLGSTIARAASLPENERLDPVRPALEKIVDDAARDGLPADLIVGKVREGLAKGASPEAIRAAAAHLARSLADADQFLRLHRKRSSSAALVRALAEARTSGVDLGATSALVESGAQDAAVVRSVEVLTDLALRGYPTGRAAFVVNQVLERDPGAVGRVVAGVEAVRVGQTVSRADALEAIGRNLQSSGGSFDAALSRSLEGGDGNGNGNGVARGQSADHQGSAAAKNGKALGKNK
jgi:hypothetical protein